MKRAVFEFARTFVIALAIAFFVGNFIILNTVVPTGSMSDTIKPGSRIVGSRLSYILKDPKRGDIVIFKYPVYEYLISKLNSTEEGKVFIKNNGIKKLNYIKRVIGLPGDTVEIKDGKIYINGSATPLDEPYLREEWVVECSGYSFEVPDDSYLMLGDNRNDSEDARYWVGETKTWLEQAGVDVNEDEIKDLCFIKKSNIVGKAIFQYWKGFKKLF